MDFSWNELKNMAKDRNDQKTVIYELYTEGFQALTDCYFVDRQEKKLKKKERIENYQNKKKYFGLNKKATEILKILIVDLIVMFYFA